MNTNLKKISAMLCLLAAQLGNDVRAHELTLAQAREILATATRHAQDLKAPGGAIAVVDSGGAVIALERMDNTFAAAADVSIGKARTAAMFRKPTRLFEETVNQGRFTMIAVAAVTHFTPLQGGVPLMINGEYVGAIGVSGASSAKQDDEIAQAAADVFAQHDR